MTILSYLVAGLVTTAATYAIASTDTVAATGTHTHTMIYLHGTCGTGPDNEDLFAQDTGPLYNANLKAVLPTAPYVYNEREQMSCNSWFATYNVATTTWILLGLELLTLNWCGAFRRLAEATVN